MPVKINNPLVAGGDVYMQPFVGPIDHLSAVLVDISNLTSDEVDADGYVKPGVPLTKLGALIGALTISTVAAGVLANGNANGTIGTATGGYGFPSETITVTLTGTGATAAFRVEGSKSGFIGTGAVGTAFTSPQISFLLSDGSTDWEAGDVVTYAVTGGTTDKLFGVTAEAFKVAEGNTQTLRDAAGNVEIPVVLIGAVNQKIAEDNLGRVYTNAEKLSFELAGSKLVLLAS